MFQQIIVPLDGSEDATLAVGPASALAQRLGVPMHVFSLHKPDDDPEEAHDALVAQLGPTGDVPRVVEVAPIRKSVAEDIRELAARNAPSLIVMASHGRGRSAAVIGSVANDILAHGEQPVLLVGPASIAGRFRTHGPALVSVSGDDDRVLLDTTAELLGETDFEPVVIHVMKPDSARQLDLAHLGPSGSDFPMESVAAERAAHALEGSTDRVAIDFDVYHARNPAQAIVEQASARRAGVIVMATHARHGLDRLSHGSVTADVVREAPCPVLVIGLG